MGVVETGDRRGHVRRVLASLIAGAVLASACAPAAEAPAVDTPPYVDGMTPPLTVLLESGLTYFAALDTAVDRVIVGCMQNEGFRYEAIDRTQREPYWGPEFTVESARRDGYSDGVELTSELDALSPEYREYMEGLSKASRREFGIALGGPEDAETISVDTGSGILSTSAEGCLAVAETKVGGDAETVLSWYGTYNQIQGLSFEAGNRLDIDREWLATLASWSGCMQARGYNVGSVEDAFSLATSGDPAERPTSEPTTPPPSTDDAVAVEPPRLVTAWERDVAVADATCREEVEYQSTWNRVRFKYEHAVLAENEGVLFAWQEAEAGIRDALPDIILREFEDS